MDKAIGAGDVDGDGNPDIVGSSGAWRSATAQGTSRFPVPFASGDDGPTVLVTDVNADGMPDIVLHLRVRRASPSFSTRGNRAFGAPTAFPVLHAGSSGLAAADFDGDGRVDLAVGINDLNGTVTSPAISVLPGDGHGGFGAPIEVDASGGSHNSLFVADLNGDGKPDLVANNQSGASFSVLLNGR